MSSLSLALRMEKNVIYLLLGRLTIKKLVHRAAGKNGAQLVDQMYKLAGNTLGKREAKKFIQTTLNIIAEVSVLTMHGKLTQHELELIRRSVISIVNKFKDIQAEITEVRSQPGSRELTDRFEDWKKRFTHTVRRAEYDLLRLLQPHCQLSTMQRLTRVSKTLRDPIIVNACFQNTESDVNSLIQDIIQTSGKISQDQIQIVESRSKSNSKRKRSRR